MTRKQFVKRMRVFYANIRKIGIKNGHTSKGTTRVPIPKWGYECNIGRHKGEKIVSYQQAWEHIVDCMYDVPEFLEGIDKIKK